MSEASATEAYVCDDAGSLIGKIDIHSLTNAVSLTEAIDPNPTVLAADANVNIAMTTASTLVGESIPVVNKGVLVGALSEGDIFNKVSQIQASLRQLR